MKPLPPLPAPDDGALWRPLPGWPYEVSDRGNVRRARSASATRVNRMLLGRVQRNGYRYVTLSDASTGRKQLTAVHALVAATFLGRAPGQPVNHKNGDKTDNRLANLELSTAAENAEHAASLGLLVRGSRISWSRLSESEIPAIRAAAKSETIASLARRYCVSETCIRQVVQRKSWAWIS